MNVILFILGVLVVCVGGFYVACYIIRLWTGCNHNEAVAKLHSLLNGKIQYSFSNDEGFVSAVWENVKNVIGEKRFEELRKLSNTSITTPLLSFGMESGLPYIAVSVGRIDDNEKAILQHILPNLVKKYLHIYGYGEDVLIDWKERFDLKMPFLEIRYARTSEERRILGIAMHYDQQDFIAKNGDVIDDLETDDLNE